MGHSLETYKKQAKTLRSSLAESGTTISHSQALEMVAHQQGYRDWNTLHGAIGQQSPQPPVMVGENLRGHYLGQPVTGKVIGVQTRVSKTRWRVTLQLDKPVDVVRFDSFSAYRSRISVVIDAKGVTKEKTSDGVPHFILAR